MAIRLKRGTAAQWTSQNPVLLDGQPGTERDTGRVKVGDGVTAWTALPYVEAAAIAAHVAASDPHPVYLTGAEGNAAYDAIGAATSAVSTHTAATDPHGDRAYTLAQIAALYRGAWAATTAYKAGQIVSAPDGSLQSAIADFTSGSTFAASNWNLFSGDGVRTWHATTVYGLGDLVINAGITYYTTIAHTSTSSFDATKFTALPASASVGNVDDLLPLAAGSVITSPDRTTGTNGVGKYNRTDRRTRFDTTLPRGGRRLAVIDSTAKLTTSGGSATLQSTSTFEPLVMTSNVAEAVFPFGTPRTAKLTTNLSPTLDFSTGQLRFPIRVDIDDNVFNTFCVEVSSDGFSTANYHQYVINNTGANFITPGRWCMVSAAFNEFTVVGTGANLAAINNIRIRHQPNSPNTVTIGLGFFDYVPPVLDRALAVLWFDDSVGDFWQWALVTMAPYGFPGVMATIPGSITTSGSGLHIDQLMRMHDFHGWQIATHAYTNTEHAAAYSALTGDTLVGSFERSFAWMQSQGLYGYQDGSCYGGPSGGVKQFNTDQYYAARKMLRSLRANFSACRMAETLPPGDPWSMRAYLTNTGDAFTTEWKPYVDKAIAAKGLAEFVFHNSNVNSTATQAEFAALLAYLDANRATIEVVTKDELWRRLDAVNYASGGASATDNGDGTATI